MATIVLPSVNRSGRAIKNVRWPDDDDDAASKNFVAFSAVHCAPTEFVYAAAVTLDVSANSNVFQMTDIMTNDMTFTLTGGQDGDDIAIAICQAAAGGKKITAITIAGRTVLMDDDLTTINTVPMLVASAKSILRVRWKTVNAVALCRLSIKTGIAAAFT